MIGTKNDPFDGGPRPPAPDLLSCAQARSGRSMPVPKKAPAPRVPTTARRDHLRGIIAFSGCSGRYFSANPTQAQHFIEKGCQRQLVTQL
jgi:hypothetical protein